MKISKEIEIVSAFRVNGKLFNNIKAAEEYIYESLDDVQLGDYVSVPGGLETMFGTFGLAGIVTCIENDLIWFATGEFPDELVKINRIKHSSNYYEFKGRVYKWTIAHRKRSQLERKYLPFYKINLT